MGVHYRLRKNTNTELWVNINYVRTPTQIYEYKLRMSQYKLRMSHSTT